MGVQWVAKHKHLMKCLLFFGHVQCLYFPCLPHLVWCATLGVGVMSQYFNHTGHKSVRGSYLFPYTCICAVSHMGLAT